MNRHTLLLLALTALGTGLAFLGFQATGATRLVLGVLFFLFVGVALLLDYFVLKATSGGLLPLLLGVICLTLAACLSIDHWLFLRSAVVTKSDVWLAVPTSVSLNRWQKLHTLCSQKFGRSKGRSGDLILEAGVLYDDGQGNYRWASGKAIPFAFPDEDGEIAVAYLPSAPAQARITGWLFWHGPALSAAAGGALVAVGVILVFRRRKAPAVPPPPATPTTSSAGENR